MLRAAGFRGHRGAGGSRGAAETGLSGSWSPSSGGEESFLRIRGIKKSLPQLSSSSGRPRKDTASTSEKTVHQAIDDYQPCDVFKKGDWVNESRQKSSTMNAGPPWNKAHHSTTSSGRRQSKLQAPHADASLQPKGSRAGVSQPTEHDREESMSPEGKAGRCWLGPRPSGSKLFLDFRSLKIIKEGADEDSASDLSDSERIPIPSPLTPPDLHLRAEEIDPVAFDLPPGQGHARPEYCYPDVLPPPFCSWDLRDMAVLLHTEHKPGAVPRTGGPLGRYVDRLMQLEWLQIQTVQGERGKGARASAGPLKSPGGGKLTASAPPRPRQEGAPKSGPSRKKGFRRGGGPPAYDPFEPPAVHVLSSRGLCPQKHSLDTRTEDKKKRASRGARLPRWDEAGSDLSLRMESNGNMRVPKPSPVVPDSADSYAACKAPAHTSLKMKGHASNCGQATRASEKKLKTNGGKQNAHKFK